MTTFAIASLASYLLCAFAWFFTRGIRARKLIAILVAVSFAGFLVGVWFAAGPAIDAR